MPDNIKTKETPAGNKVYHVDIGNMPLEEVIAAVAKVKAKYAD
jgi:hypothetical protein|tara:strand:- start:399 stop:527 length:129 start_codon:yes stop_codon:yes gene_type:complete